MQIDFIDAESFLEECEKRAIANDLAERMVRVQKEANYANPTLKISMIRAGFLSMSGDLFQFKDVCGKDPPDRNTESGEAVADKLETLLKEKLTALGIEVRKGLFVG